MKKSLAIVGVVALALPGLAFAGIDLTAITGAGGAVETATSDITAVGTAIVGLAALAMTIRWVKATFF